MQQEVCAARQENTLNFSVQTITAFCKHSNKPALNNVQMSELHYNLLFKAALTGSSPPTGHALTWSTNSPAPKHPKCFMAPVLHDLEPLQQPASRWQKTTCISVRPYQIMQTESVLLAAKDNISQQCSAGLFTHFAVTKE